MTKFSSEAPETFADRWPLRHVGTAAVARTLFCFALRETAGLHVAEIAKQALVIVPYLHRKKGLDEFGKFGPVWAAHDK